MPRRGWRESFRWWLDPTIPVRHLSDTQDRREGVYACIDRQNFDWRVFAVAASGFLTDSYNLFATNIILPAIAFIYWRNVDPNVPNDDFQGRWEVAINIATLGGSVIGQLLFGFLADRFGRRRLYGLELIIVIVSTLGLAQASAGFYNQNTNGNSMSIQAWLIFYRLLQGIGIGGEYPMSAVITAEFASVRSRARMMAAVFLMQPLGQLLAAVIGIGVIYGYSSTDPTKFGPNYNVPWQTVDHNVQGDTGILDADIQVDKIWRWVIGVGAIPAFVAILFRLTIPESPRYTLDVDEDASRALRDALAHYGSTSTVSITRAGTEVSADLEMPADAQQRAHHQRHSLDISPGASRRSSVISADSLATPVPTIHRTSFLEGFREYLFDQGNWRWLLGASLVWFILDFAFYGLGVNNPRTVAKIWASRPQSNHSNSNGTYEDSWNSDIDTGGPLSNDGDNIFFVLRNDAIRSLITSTLGSLIGSIFIIQIIPYVPRKTMLVWTFLLLSVLMIVTGGILLVTFQTDGYAAVVALYVIIQVIFNLGPNTLIFIYPAEIFPTRYRGTCYGIASASGKLSAVIVQAILPNAKFGIWQNRLNVNDTHALSFLWIIWGIMMIFGAYVSWLWLPQVQKPRSEGKSSDGFRIPSMTLEELAKGGNFKSKANLRSGFKKRIPFFNKAFDERRDGGNGRGIGNEYEMRQN